MHPLLKKILDPPLGAAILCVSGAIVVVMSETASINIIFAFSQRWGFHYFIWPAARVIVALLRRLHRSR